MQSFLFSTCYTAYNVRLTSWWIGYNSHCSSLHAKFCSYNITVCGTCFQLTMAMSHDIRKWFECTLQWFDYILCAYEAGVVMLHQFSYLKSEAFIFFAIQSSRQPPTVPHQAGVHHSGYKTKDIPRQNQW